MRIGFACVAVILGVACGPVESTVGQVVHSEAVHLATAGSVLPSGCTEAGVIFIPAREVGILEGVTGASAERFFGALSLQTEELNAHYIAPVGDVEAIEAASSGREFRGTAYRCPE